jgi:hypothetical protein
MMALNTNVTPTLGLANQSPLAQLQGAPSTTGLTSNAIQEAANQSGLGLASPDVQLAPESLEPLQVDPNQQIAPPVEEAAPVAAEQSAADSFKDDPFGSLGFLFSSIAAGLEGRESPVSQRHKQRIQQQQLELQSVGVVIDAVEGGLKFLDGVPAERRNEAIQQYIGQFGNSPALQLRIGQQLNATVNLLDQRGMTPAEGSEFAQRNKHTLTYLAGAGSKNPVERIEDLEKTEGGREFIQEIEDSGNLQSVLPKIQSVADVINQDPQIKEGLRQGLIDRNGLRGNMPVITEVELQGFPFLLQAAGVPPEIATAFSRGELQAIENIGQSEIGELLNAVYVPTAENRLQQSAGAQRSVFEVVDANGNRTGQNVTQGTPEYEDVIDSAGLSLARVSARTQGAGPTGERAEVKARVKLDEDLRKEIFDISSRIASSGEVLRDIRANPSSVSMVGFIADNLGGAIGSVLGERAQAALGTFLSNLSGAEVKSEPIAETRTRIAQFVAQNITTITGEESGRFTEAERELTNQVIAALKALRTPEQATTAVRVIVEANLLQRHRKELERRTGTQSMSFETASLPATLTKLQQLGFSENEGLDFINRARRFESQFDAIRRSK